MSKWDKYAVDETTDKWSQYSTATPGQSGQEAFQQSSQEGSWMDQLPPVQIAKQAFEGASNAFGALNPFSGEDLGQRAGKLATGVAQTLTSPLAPAVEIAKKAPGALKSGAIMGLQGLKKGVEGFQAVADAGANTGEAIRRGDIGMIGQGVKEGVYGALKSTSGVFTGASAPFAGAISGLPDFAQMPFQKIGEALEGSKEFLRSITGTTDTPEGDAIGDSIDVALGLLPLLPKAKVTTVTNKLTNSFTSPKAMMSELNGELRQSPKLAERNYNTQSFYTNISKNGFFDEYATSLVKKVGESIKELPNRLGTYVERYAEKGKGTVLDEAVADMNAVHGEVYKNLGKSVGNQSAIIENSLPIFDSIEGIARSNLGKSPIVKKLLDIRQVLDNNGSIQDLVNARTTIEDMLSKPKDKFTSTNTQLLAKLHDSIGSDLQSTMRAIGGEMSSVADDLASSTSTFKETMNTFFSDTAPTVEALPKSAQGLGMLDDTIRGNAQKSLLKGHVGTDPLKNLGTVEKSDVFSVLDDVQKAEMMRYSVLQPLGDVMSTLEGAGKAVKNTFEKIMPPKDIQTRISETVGRITQEKDAAQFGRLAQGLDELPLQGVKTYKDLGTVAQETAKALQKSKKDILSKVEGTKKLKDLTLTLKEGTVSVKKNFVSDALEQLDDFFDKTNNPLEQKKVQGVLAKAKKEGLTANEVDDIAILYNKNVSKLKSFTESGKPKKGLTAEGVENTRKGVKNTARDFMPDDTTKVLDEKISNILKVQEQSDMLADAVQNLTNKVEQRGIFGKIGRGIGTAVTYITGGFLRELATSMFLKSNEGFKTLNSIAIQDMLKKNIEVYKNLTKEIDTLPRNMTQEQVYGLLGRMSKQLRMPVDARALAPVAIGEQKPVNATTPSSLQ
jgi:tetrahydromethanopterin S-methyltransferase subunit G